MIPDLNRIKVFYYVFLRRSVALAAQDLNISASAVSQALAKLEAEVKISLFTRLHRQLVPTVAGEQLFEITSPFIQDLEIEIDSILKSKKAPAGLIRIGASMEFGKFYCPGAFAGFRKQYPEVIFSLSLGNGPQILSMLGEGELDFGLVDIFLLKATVKGDLDNFAIEPLIDEQMSLVCSADYYNRHILKDHSYDNLVKKDFISYQKSSLTLQQWFRHHFNRSPQALNKVVTVDNHQVVTNCVLQNMGLGVVSRHIVLNDIKKKRIVPITTGKTDIINKVSLVQLQNKIPSLTEKTFIRFMTHDIRRSDMAIEFGMPSSSTSF